MDVPPPSLQGGRGGIGGGAWSPRNALGRSSTLTVVSLGSSSLKSCPGNLHGNHQERMEIT